MNTLINLIKEGNYLEIEKISNLNDLLSKNNKSLLHYSVEFNQYKITELLINKGININILALFN